MISTQARSLVLLLTVALAAAGCGGGSEPDEAVRDYLTAIVDRDGKDACDQLTKELRVDIERAPAARQAGRTCADLSTLAAGLNPSLTAKDVQRLDIRVTRDGDKARATFGNPFSRRKETLRLVKEDAGWRIASLETRPRG